MRAAPDPLPTLPETADALRALLLAAWAERDSAVSERDRLAAERDSLAVERETLAVQNDRLRHLLLRHLLLRLRRMQFGARSERLPEEQLQLGLESLEQAIAQGEAEGERRDPTLKQERVARRRASRGALPAHYREAIPRREMPRSGIKAAGRGDADAGGHGLPVLPRRDGGDRA